MLGFAVVTADTLISNYLNIYFRFKAQYEEAKYGVVSKDTRRLTRVCTYTEWAVRVTLLAVSLLQSLVTHSTKGDYCIHKLGVLALEGYWLSWLILL